MFKCLSRFNGSSGGGGSYGSYGSRGGSGYGGSRGGYDRGDRYGGDRHGGRGKSDGAGMSLKAPRWDLARLSKIEKDFYTPSPATQNRPDVCSILILNIDLSYFP